MELSPVGARVTRSSGRGEGGRSWRRDESGGGGGGGGPMVGRVRVVPRGSV